MIAIPLGDEVAVEGHTTWASTKPSLPGAPVTSGHP